MLAVILSIFVVVMYNLYVLRKKNRIETVNYSNSEYDTETTANTESTSRSHKKLYHMIQGLYTSQDENHPNDDGKNAKKQRGKFKQKRKGRKPSRNKGKVERVPIDQNQRENPPKSEVKVAVKLSD